MREKQNIPEQWRSQDFSMGEKGLVGVGAGRSLQFFNKSNAFFAYFGQNSYFKAITHQSKTFKISLNVLNKINEVQVL